MGVCSDLLGDWGFWGGPGAQQLPVLRQGRGAAAEGECKGARLEEAERGAELRRRGAEVVGEVARGPAAVNCPLSSSSGVCAYIEVMCGLCGK